MEKIIFGIDISNKTLDICLIKGKQTEYFVINNTAKAITKFFNSYLSLEVLVAMENTGRYNWELYKSLIDYDFKVYVINPLHFSKSIGLSRGKDDKIDSYRIANYCKKNQDDLQQWKPTSKSIMSLKVLLTERNSRIKTRKKLVEQRHDYKKMKSIGLGIDKELMQLNKQLMKIVTEQIKKIEASIKSIIKNDELLKKQQKLILSVPGVGNITAWNMIVKSEGFTKITEARKMACFSGVVPFNHQSGTSIFKKPKISIYADKQMKSVLHMAAMSAIRFENDFGIYYRRKIEEGKNKMSVLNAVRNKIIHVIFAIIKSEKLYQNRLVAS